MNNSTSTKVQKLLNIDKVVSSYRKPWDHEMTLSSSISLSWQAFQPLQHRKTTKKKKKKSSLETTA